MNNRFYLCIVCMVIYCASATSTSYAQSEFDFKRALLNRAVEVVKNSEDIPDVSVKTVVGTAAGVGNVELVDELINECVKAGARNQVLAAAAMEAVNHFQPEIAKELLNRIEPRILEHYSILPLFAACYGHNNDREKLDQLFNEIMQLRGATYSYTPRGFGESKDKVTKTLDAECTKSLREEAGFMYTVGLIESGQIASVEKLPSLVESAVHKDLVYAVYVKHLVDNQRFDKGLEVAKLIVHEECRTWADLMLITNLGHDLESNGVAKRICDTLFDRFAKLGPYDNVYLGNLAADAPIFSGVVGQHVQQIEFHIDGWFGEKSLLDSCITCGMCETGVELAQQIEDDKRKKMWLRAVVNRLFERQQGDRANEIIDLSKKQFEIDLLSQDRDITSLLKSAGGSGEFESAEQFLSQIVNDTIRNNAEFVLAGYYYNRYDELNDRERIRANDLASRMAESFREQVQTIDESGKPKFIVEYIMRLGWTLGNQIDSIPISESIKDEFRKVENHPDATKMLLRGLGSFTPPTPSARSLLQEILVSLDYQPDETERTKAGLNELKNKLKQLANGNYSPIERREFAEKLTRLAVKMVRSIGDSDQRDLRCAELAYLFAEFGDQKACEEMFNRIVDSQEQIRTAAACAKIFPPKTRLLFPVTPDFSRSALSGGMF